MSATPSKLFVGFIGFILSVFLYSGLGIAEQTAEKESHVVLEVGTRGILPCRIQTKAYLVQWKRQLISEHLLVYLDPHCNGSARAGPGYKAELFDITDDYSLIIKDVKVENEGLYICEVLDFQTGKVFRNRTRVFVQGTGASVVLEMGARGILPCGMQRGAYRVKWKRQLSSETEVLVSLDQYFKVDTRDGSGYEAGLFNITDDYSLVIKDVKVQDEGLYMCTLFDFKKGKVFRNSTRVFVQAFPDEPFPAIRECVRKDVNPGDCSIVHSTSNLTCFVKGFYPDIDLFFLHGSEKVTSTEDEEWSNADGTKNKEIRVQISESDEPYQCVASDLPGIGGNRSVSAIVEARPQARSQGPHATTIVIPVLITAGMCLSITFILVKCYLRKGRVCCSKRGFVRVPELPEGSPMNVWNQAPEGPVSKPELWKLVTLAKEKDDLETLSKALCRLRRLSKTVASNLKKDVDFFKILCKWKRKTASYSYQREALYYICCQVGMSDITRKLKDFVLDTSYEVSRADIEHILWDIKDTRKIAELLKTLKIQHEAVVTEANKRGIREVINIARIKLLDWRQSGKFDINPVVTLSLILEDLHCETNFFQLQGSQKEVIDEEEMKNICCQIFDRQFQSLLRAVRGNHGKLAYQLRIFVEENNASLLNALRMLKDWGQSQECSNYEKRNKLEKAAEVAKQRDHTEDKWPPDDELSVIASFLSPASMKQLCSKLGIGSPPEEPLHALKKWRDNYASLKDLEEEHHELFAALKAVERAGLVARVKGHLVYKAELVDLAFHLFAQDLLPFTEALGINAATLVDYRPAFHPSHMTQGTIGFVCKLFESGERSNLLNLMKNMPYPNVHASGMLANGISFGELCAVYRGSLKQARMQRSNSIHGIGESSTHESHNSTTGKKSWKKDEANLHSSRSSLSSFETSHTKTQRDVTYNVSIQRDSEYDIFEETTKSLATMLATTDIAKDQSLRFIESMILEYFKRMREQSCLTPFSCRLALAKALSIVGNDSQAYALIRGDYQIGNIPFTFIYDILRNITSEQLYHLHSLIRNTGSIPFTLKLSVNPLDEQGWFQMMDLVSLQTGVWIEKWIQHWNSTKTEEGEKDLVSTTEIAKKHKEFNDKLVDLGFIDLAREIMINEQQLV